MGTFFTEERDGWVRDAVAKVAGRWPGVTQKPMMGCACFWAGGKMFAIAANGCVVLTQLSAEERAKVAGEPFWTGPNRPPIRKWVQVRMAEPTDVEDLAPLLRTSYERARAAEA